MVLFALRDEEFQLKDYVFQCLSNFFIFGSYYHLWYIPVMAFSAAVTYWVYKKKKLHLLLRLTWVTFLFGCMGTAYYNVFNRIAIIGKVFKWKYLTQFIRFLCRGLPFFVLGTEVNLHRDKELKRLFEKSESIKTSIAVSSFVVFILFVVEHYLIAALDLMESPVQTLMLMPYVALLVIILLRHPLSHMNRLGKVCSVCSSFVYFSHPAIILVLQKLSERLGIQHFLSPTLSFVLTVVLGTLSGFAIAIRKNVMTWLMMRL